MHTIRQARKERDKYRTISLPCYPDQTQRRAIRLARRTLRIANQNIVFALAVKVAVLVLSALGLVNMWFAVFADVGVAVLAICNALRALRAPK